MNNITDFLKMFLPLLNSEDFEIEEKEDGIIIRFKEISEDIQNIKEDIDNIENDIFREAAALLKKEYPDKFEIMQTIDDKECDIEGVKEAYTYFKTIVKKVVSDKIINYVKEINRLRDKYLSEQD